MAQNKIKFAVIGCGHIGKRHATMIEQHKDAQLVALCDIKDPEILGIAAFDVPCFNNIENITFAKK